MVNVKRKSTITPAQIIAARGVRTQAQAASVIGVSLRQFRNYEKGATAMYEAHFRALEATKPALNLPRVRGQDETTTDEGAQHD